MRNQIRRSNPGLPCSPVAPDASVAPCAVRLVERGTALAIADIIEPTVTSTAVRSVGSR